MENPAENLTREAFDAIASLSAEEFGSILNMTFKLTLAVEHMKSAGFAFKAEASEKDVKDFVFARQVGILTDKAAVLLMSSDRETGACAGIMLLTIVPLMSEKAKEKASVDSLMEQQKRYSLEVIALLKEAGLRPLWDDNIIDQGYRKGVAKVAVLVNPKRYAEMGTHLTFRPF